jgi:hypothetical protein
MLALQSPPQETMSDRDEEQGERTAVSPLCVCVEPAFSAAAAAAAAACISTAHTSYLRVISQTDSVVAGRRYASVCQTGEGGREVP